MVLRNQKRFSADINGIAMMEFAFLFPVFLLMTMGAIEFGYYFVKAESAARAVSTTIQSIQRNPTDSSLQTLANNSGGTMINFGQGGSYVCAKAYSTYAAAQTGLCTSQDWNTASPNSSSSASSTPYYIAVKVYAPQSLITPLGEMMHNMPALAINQSAIVQVGGGNTGNTAWVTVPPNQFIGRAYSPSQWCQQKGYHTAVGNCRGDASSSGDASPLGITGNPYEGTIRAVAQTLSGDGINGTIYQWQWICDTGQVTQNVTYNGYNYGYHNVNQLDSNTQIQCY